SYRCSAQDEAQQVTDDKGNQYQPASEENHRRNQIRPEMIYPPSGNRRKGEHNCDDEGTFALRNRNNTGNEHQRKQSGYNEIATFDFLNERRTDEKGHERNQELHRGKATPPH